MTHNPRAWWGIAAICLTAFITIAILSAQIFEHVPHSEDEVAYIFQAKVFAQNRLTVSTPPFDAAFWSPFVVDYQGRRFGKYHPGWPLLLSLGVRANVPWLVNALLAALTLALIAGLGRCFYCHSSRDVVCYVSIMAAGLGLVTPGFLFLSSSLLSHTTSLFWSTLALVALFYLTKERPVGQTSLASSKLRPALIAVTEARKEKAHVTPNTLRSRPIYAVLTGLALGAMFITRPFAALGIGLAMGIFLLFLIIRGELKWTVLLWLTLGGLPLAALLPLYWRGVTGDPTFNGYLLVWPYDRIGFGPDIGPYGYTLHNAIFINTRLKLTALATGLFGWPGWSNLLFLPIPFLAQWFNRQDRLNHQDWPSRWDWLLVGTILGVVVIHNFYWAFGGVDGGFPRYYYDALPGLLLLTARGIQISIQYLKQRQMHWLLIGLVVTFIGYNLIWNLPSLLAAQKGKYNITSVPLQVVEQANLPEPALILVKDVGSWSDFAAFFAANSPTLNDPIVYAIDWGPELTQQLRRQFAARTCWELRGEMLQPCPAQ